jgi:hypothetical protein
MPLDRSLVLSFTLPVNRSVIESAISILPAPTRLIFTWRNNVELEMSMFLRPSISYTLDLAPERPGINGEVMGAPFHIEFTTASNYSLDHTLRSFTIFPDPEKELQSGGNLTINGLIDDSAGYIVTIRVLGEGYDSSYTGMIGSDGSWQMTVPIPGKGGKYDLTVTIGMPDAPSAIPPRTISFNVAKAEDGGDGDTSGLLTALGIFAILLVICIVVTAAVLYIFAQRKRAERELGSREYDEVDMDMEE